MVGPFPGVYETLSSIPRTANNESELITISSQFPLSFCTPRLLVIHFYIRLFLVSGISRVLKRGLLQPAFFT